MRVIEPFKQFFDGAGDPLVNGWLLFLQSGSVDAEKDTYRDSAESLLNTNPLQLDAEGRCPDVFGSGVYKVILFTNDTLLSAPGSQEGVKDPVGGTSTTTDWGPWDANAVYSENAIVKAEDGEFYESRVSNNQNNNPTTSDQFWVHIAYQQYWNENVTYATGARVVDTLNGFDYLSLTDNNLNNQPSLTVGSEWESFAVEASVAGVKLEGDIQEARLIAEGDTQDDRVIAQGDAQVARLTGSGIVAYTPLHDYPALLSYVVGSDGSLYQALATNGPSTTPVDPVGDATGVWAVVMDGPQLLGNAEMLVNQDAFAGGALSAGVYGYDMWKASIGGANLTVANGVVSLVSGGIEQNIADPNLVGKNSVLSVIMNSGSLSYDVDGVSGTLTGTGLQIASIPGASIASTNIQVKLSGTAVFSELKLQQGAYSKFHRKPLLSERMVCYSEYFKSLTDEFEILSVASGTQDTAQKVTFPVPMRNLPAVSTTVVSGSAIVSGAFNISTEAFKVSFTGGATLNVTFSFVADARP